MMESAYEKKRVGLARNQARSLIKRFKKATGTKINYEVPVVSIAEYLRFKIQYLNSMDDSHSAIIYPESMVIGINGRHHPHRQRFSLGHELGHYLLRHPPELELSPEEAKVCNREADEFSGELLVPLELVKKALTITKDLSELSELFNVSRDVITIRLINQNLLK
jgi:Zn-dependent peptidase ImmA (M78 family)